MSNQKISFASMGECMLELTQKNHNDFNMSFAGDTYNVSVYLARCSDLSQVDVSYVTAIGMDPYSEQMLLAWHSENINTYLVRRLPQKIPGLYLIRTDAQGERNFYYYRSESAAKKMLAGEVGDELLQQLLNCHYFYFSSISIAILPEDDRIKFLEFIKEAQAKGVITVFDTNYRPLLWSSKQAAKSEIEKFLEHVVIALPSLDDEQLLFEDHDFVDCAKRFHNYGVKEIVVKHGKEGCFLSNEYGQKLIPAPLIEKVVDTTAAGDSFNGAYLAARIRGENMETAAKQAMQVAAAVIACSGAIIPREKMPRLI